MRVASLFHAMRSLIGARLPSRYSRTRRDQTRSFDQELERARHLARLEVALRAHHVLEQAYLAVVDEQRQLARVGEIHLGGEQRQAGEAPSRLRAPWRRGDRGKRAAEAIAGEVHLAIRDDAADRLERLRHAEARGSRPSRGRARRGPGFFHEIMNTVWPRSTRYFTSEFAGERSRM